MPFRSFNTQAVWFSEFLSRLTMGHSIRSIARFRQFWPDCNLAGGTASTNRSDIVPTTYGVLNTSSGMVISRAWSMLEMSISKSSALIMTAAISFYIILPSCRPDGIICQIILMDHIENCLSITDHVGQPLRSKCGDCRNPDRKLGCRPQAVSWSPFI
jgi:hypothetical protein